MHDFSINILPSCEYGLYAADGRLLASFGTYTQAERAARNLYGFSSPAPLDPVVYSDDIDAALDTECLDREAA